MVLRWTHCLDSRRISSRASRTRAQSRPLDGHVPATANVSPNRLNAQGRRSIVPAACRGRSTWPLSPTSRIAAQNAACVLDTTGTRAGPPAAAPPRACATRRRRSAGPRRRAPRRIACEPSAMMSASLILPGSPKPNRPKPSSAEHVEALRLEKALEPLVHLVRIGGGHHDPLSRRSGATRRPPPGSWC